MKLASLAGGRDGRLVVVSRNLQQCVPADAIAPTLQQALDNWANCAPLLEDLAKDLETGRAPAQSFDPALCASPLPRAYQFLDGSAFVNHVALVRRARGAPMPERFWTDPLMYQGGSDSFLAPLAAIPLPDEAWGLDLEGEVAVITDDVAIGADEETCEDAIRLVMLMNDVSLRNLIGPELEKGLGFVQSKPASAFAPVAVSLDELGGAWRDGRLNLPLKVRVNGQLIGRANAGPEMTFSFPSLIAHAARTRNLCAGTIIGSGTISNRGLDGGPGLPIAEGGVGYSCLAELRAVEEILHGQARTPYLQAGDRVEIEMHDESGCSIFGRIDQVVAHVEANE
jgi:fumarylacetoacetate (FAA) hydrolase